MLPQCLSWDSPLIIKSSEINKIRRHVLVVQVLNLFFQICAQSPSNPGHRGSLSAYDLEFAPLNLSYDFHPPPRLTLISWPSSAPGAYLWLLFWVFPCHPVMGTGYVHRVYTPLQEMRLSLENKEELLGKRADHGEIIRLKMNTCESKIEVRKLNSKSCKLQPFDRYRKQERLLFAAMLACFKKTPFKTTLH